MRFLWWWCWCHIAVALCLRCYCWIEEHRDGVHVILELVWFGLVEWRFENGRRRSGLVWFVCLLLVFSLQWERRCIAISNRSVKWMLKDEIHIPAECSSLQSLGLWSRLLLDISAPTLHTVYIQCRRRRFYSAKERAYYSGVILLLREAFWWDFGSPLYSCFQEIHKFVQYFVLADGFYSCSVVFLFLCFFALKNSALCAPSSLFGYCRRGQVVCLFEIKETWLQFSLLRWYSANEDHCLHLCFPNHHMRVRSKELPAMPLGRVHYFVSKPRSDCFFPCLIGVFQMSLLS